MASLAKDQTLSVSQRILTITTGLLAGLFTASVLFTGTAFAEQTATEQVKEAGRDLKTGTKKAVRKVKDETCEMVNGKMECAAKKVGNKVDNAVDDVKDGAKNTKEKVD